MAGEGEKEIAMMTIANLHNVKTNRYHPILFRESPQPSWSPGDPLRSKSSGHHTKGFDTREEAIAECKQIAERQQAKLCIEKDFSWDGEGMPAMVVFFGEQNGEVVPLF